MTWGQVASKYFLRKTFEDNNVRVTMNEKGNFQVSDEEYSLRVSTWLFDSEDFENNTHRNYAIEHHTHPNPHTFPHLQFKLASEGIGELRIKIDIENSQQYEDGILGFIYKIKTVIQSLEINREGITEEMMILEEVNKLKDKGEFLENKIYDGIRKYALDIAERSGEPDKIQRMKTNPLMIDFIGQKNIDLIEEQKFEQKK